MRKGRNWMHMKRVSAAPKERLCVVPGTLLVAAWALVLLLLLTSSISHTDNRDQALYDSSVATQKLKGDLTCGGPGVSGDGDGGEQTTLDGCPTMLSAELQQDQSGHVGSLTDGEEWTSCFNTLVPSTRTTWQDSGETIDALQYAEYGAGLLQKNGPVEESFKILIGDVRGTQCGMIGHHGELIGNKCLQPKTSSGDKELPCLNEILAVDHSHDAVSYGEDVVAELEPGENYLICHSDSLTGIVFCGVACTSESECFLSEDGSKFCQSDCSFRDYVHQTCQIDNGFGQLEASTTEPGLPSQSTRETDGDHYPSLIATASESDLVDSNEQDVDILGDKSEEVQAQNTIDGKLLVMDPFHSSENDSAIQQVTDMGYGANTKSKDNKELSSSAESKDTLIGKETPVELLQAALHRENGIWEEEDLDDQNVTPHVNMEQEPRRLKHVGSVMSLGEYKRSILEKQQKSGSQVDLSSVQTQKVRHSDESYNYAAASYGAKLLASNKEAKGANHILVSDKDKYLRNPCGAEDKFVMLELSEETFVDTLVIANFEFHSSNLKDFELLGSPVLPAKEWISLGKFHAENVRDRQKFNINDPKLVRYLMLKMLSHWGLEFFCTLSVVEVFGVDVIKNLLDDWISLEEVETNARTQGTSGYVAPQDGPVVVGTGQQLEASKGLFDLEESLLTQPVSDFGSSSDQKTGGRDIRGKAASSLNESLKAGSTGDVGQEVVHIPGGKPPGDSVLKILMLRVKALELNQTLFDLYLADMNQKYKAMLSELDKDLAVVTERLQNEMTLTASLAMRFASRELQRKEEKLSMEHHLALIASNLTHNLDFMRWQIQSLERREILAIVLALLCMSLSASLHLLACCISRKVPTHECSLQLVSEVMDDKLDSPSLSCVCNTSSVFVLYLASGLIILILSV